MPEARDDIKARLGQQMRRADAAESRLAEVEGLVGRLREALISECPEGEQVLRWKSLLKESKP